MASDPFPCRAPTKPATKIKGGADNVSRFKYVWAT